MLIWTPSTATDLLLLRLYREPLKEIQPTYMLRHNGKKVKFSSPNAFFAEKKEIVDTSYPGDIVGIHDTGNFKIGDTLTEGEHFKLQRDSKFFSRTFQIYQQCRPIKIKTALQRD